MPDAGPAPAADIAARARAGWRARLELGFAKADARTRLVRRAHEGPLVVQKPLYPEGDDICQCIVVHPPGGIAGGDDIELRVDVDSGAYAQLTTPGATRWYRSAGADAAQRIVFSVADGGVLEWLPQGTIVFDGAHAATDVRVELAGNASYLGWDVICLGRTESSEQFTKGRWHQRCDILRDGALIWSERMVLGGNSPWLSSPAGLNRAPVFGTFVVMFTTCDDSTLNACRGLAPVEGEGTVTRLPGSLVARYRGASSESAHAYFTALWSLVRPVVSGRAAVIPRIWRT
jgi:urease accessory protein